MLNIPSPSFPPQNSQQRVTPSGQTGRNKVMLKPGHSLMDWIRFCKSGKDLTGLRGRLIEVTHEELQKHNTRNDCWTCIRGMVYNVTPYMDYHPGGEEELMKAAGIDGTDLFDQVHRWVNYESMLKECLVGRMMTKATTAKGIIPPVPPTSLIPSSSVAPSSNKDSRPWFDWFQTDVTVHLVIYAKRKIPTTGCSIIDLKAGVLRVELLLGKMSYMIHLRLTNEVEGTVAAFFYRDCVLVSKTEVNHNTYVFRLQMPRGTVMHVPVGKHVYLKSLNQDTEVVRPYTPVDQNLATSICHSSKELDLYLMIKIYPDGVFTPYLNSMHIGDHISVSGPEGTFSLRPLRDVTNLYLLAAGTGFTPMARLIRLALQDMSTIRKTQLLFFNRREEDILSRHELDDLAANNESFQVEYVLSEPCESWTGKKGQVDKYLLDEFLIRPEGSKCYVCICGPAAFTDTSLRLLKQLGFSQEELHAFQG
ncbi:cytochrome b5 reductase 4 isoform X2 [Parambassis ranga]|uniref:Cytochrome b5 reductase 4 isoform X2 n=1 Tax=Parambassis ranga TaxID=210632 RepID=A0A6P7JZK5_9TELE|nr:cytochrome b5 reductase 4 isoform X2 [Parambassis ranga]